MFLTIIFAQSGHFIMFRKDTVMTVILIIVEKTPASGNVAGPVPITKTVIVISHFSHIIQMGPEKLQM